MSHLRRMSSLIQRKMDVETSIIVHLQKVEEAYLTQLCDLRAVLKEKATHPRNL